MEMTMEEAATEEAIEGMKKATETCFELNGVARQCTYVSTDRKRFVCVMEAPDVAAARRSLESAQIPYGKIWAATSF